MDPATKYLCITYATVLILPFVLSLVATPLCRAIAKRFDVMDVPSSERHKKHGKATPLLGGMAAFSAWAGAFIILALAAFSVPDLVPSAWLGGILSVKREILAIGLGGGASVLLGLVDDVHPMKAGKKLFFQILIACATVALSGIRISLFISNPVFTFAVTAFWMVFIFNAMNFFDNMDGLASGTGAIAFFFFAAAAIANGQYFAACLCLCSAGAFSGFWIYNSSPASIFLGDSGSHFLGFLLGIVSIKVTYFDPAVASGRFSVLIPLFILAVPVFDALAVVAIRLHDHKPIYVGDHNHISHRFHHMGMTRKRAVQIVHLLSIIAGLGALPLLWGDERTCLLLLIQGIMILALMCLIQYAGRQMETSANDGKGLKENEKL